MKFSFLTHRSKLKTQKNFFEFSAAERKKIIKKASIEAINKQRTLMKEYSPVYCKSN